MSPPPRAGTAADVAQLIADYRARLSHADLHRVGSLLAHAARTLAASGHRPLCPAGISTCPVAGPVCLACAVDRAAEDHAGPPTDPVDRHFPVWRQWRRLAAFTKPLAVLAAHVHDTDAATALSATATAIRTGRTRP